MVPRRLGVTPAVFALAFAAACGGKEEQPAPAAEPPREIELAPTKPAEPQLADVPEKTGTQPKRAAPAKQPVSAAAPPKTEAPPPPEPAPAPVAAAPAAPAPVPTGMVSAGASLTVHPEARICTNTHKVGDRFTTTLREPVHGTNGLVIPAGATVTMRVIESGAHLQIYHIGTPEAVSMRDVAHRIAHHLGLRIRLVPGPSAAGGTTHRCPDIRKLQALGFQPRVSFDEGLRATVAWYAAHAIDASPLHV